eukprot:8870129-Pyramimonas_sp.AAC.1
MDAGINFPPLASIMTGPSVAVKMGSKFLAPERIRTAVALLPAGRGSTALTMMERILDNSPESKPAQLT